MTPSIPFVLALATLLLPLPSSAGCQACGGESAHPQPLSPLLGAEVVVAYSAGFQSPFDASATARLRTGEMVEAIKASGQQKATPPPKKLLLPALLIQAGLRTLLPPAQREGLVLPGPRGLNDPPSLVQAQRNLTVVYQGGREATPRERATAKQAIQEGALLLAKQGYIKAASLLRDWVNKNP